MKLEIGLLLGAMIVIIIVLSVVGIQRDNYKRALINHNVARYVVDDKGYTSFEIDEVKPTKKNKKAKK